MKIQKFKNTHHTDLILSPFCKGYHKVERRTISGGHNEWCFIRTENERGQTGVAEATDMMRTRCRFGGQKVRQDWTWFQMV